MKGRDNITHSAVNTYRVRWGLPDSCLRLAFDRRELLARLPSDDVVRLLCEPSLDPSLKQRALASADVFKRIDARNVLTLLKNQNLPGPCALTIADGFKWSLPVADVVGFLALSAVSNLEIKRTVLTSHADQLTAEQLLVLLRHRAIPAELKTETVSSTPLLTKVLQGNPLGLLGDDHVPEDCRRTVANQMDLVGIPREQLVEALELLIIPEFRRKELVIRRRNEFSGQDVCRVLASEHIPVEIKKEVFTAKSLAKLEPQHALHLLASRHTPTAFSKHLVAMLTEALSLRDIEAIFAAAVCRMHSSNNGSWRSI